MKNNKMFKNWGLFKKGMDPMGIQLSFASHLEYSLAKDEFTATMRDLYTALALTARDRLIERWIRTQQLYHEKLAKRVYYLSAEYLMGRVLLNNLINLDMYESTVQAMDDVSVDITALFEKEPDMGLGNGGLGRLAACFLDSMATLEIPAYGYGIRYEFGIFDQKIDGRGQTELPENWLKYGNPWEVARPEYNFPVRFYGRVDARKDLSGRTHMEWVDTDEIIGVAYDTPIAGYDVNTVNTLRLWSARASNEFDLGFFQGGDYLRAVEEKNISENISKVLYPNDSIYEGRELRLKQQYFFVSCTIQDILRRFRRHHQNRFELLPEKAAIQLNDTHPGLAVVELMRILVDEYNVPWKTAWEITTSTCAYTNHTLLSEALEKWPVPMMNHVLPRHLQIIYEINRRFLRDVSGLAVSRPDCIPEISLIEEGGEKQVRMANLCVVGSHSVNGVARLHSRLIKEQALKSLYEIFPERFNNKTNGVTPRRWLLGCNPGLSDLITGHIGDGWELDMIRLRQLEPLADDAAFQEKWHIIKLQNKEVMAKLAHSLTRISVDPESIFDFQVKRIHEYKRQTLNILHAVYLWLRLKRDPQFDIVPRAIFFGGKAAPGYYMAKLIIRFICQVAAAINRDSATRSRLRVLFLPNYRVSLAEKIFPAADISQQISTAGFEASGTSNMKFAMNGALTLGTLDGANIEIQEEVGEENLFIFGLNADEVNRLRPEYNPRHYIDQDPLLAETLNLIRSGFFSPGDPHAFKPLVDSLEHHDAYMVLADFESYHQAQMAMDSLYRTSGEWSRKAILNVARSGKFSSDRTIREYNDEIWQCPAVKVTTE